MATKRHYKTITAPDDVKEILDLTYERSCTKNLIMDWFGDFGDGPRFNPYDIIDVPKGKYGNKKKNKNNFTTTIGLWVFNWAFLSPFSDLVGYINEPITDSMYSSLNRQLSYALAENKITVQQMKDFITQSQIMMSCCSALCPSHTMDMLLIDSKAQKVKKELEEEYGDAIASGDLSAEKQLEDNLIEFAKEELKDSESVDMYNSGARSSWSNNFKNMYLTRGAQKGVNNNYEYVSSSYIGGLDPKDFVAVNDAAVGGPYSRAKKTQSGGYQEKLFTRLTQHIEVGSEGSDCGTTKTIKVTLNNKNINDWMYSFVQNSNGTTTEITSDTRDKFIGKTVNMRFSALCESKNGICEKCAGTLFRRAGIKNAGLVSMVMMSSVKVANMKAFHDSTLKLADVDPNKVFSLR